MTGMTPEMFASTRANIFFDLEAAYRLGEAVTITIGGRNVLNNYPEENPNATARR